MVLTSRLRWPHGLARRRDLEDEVGVRVGEKGLLNGNTVGKVLVESGVRRRYAEPEQESLVLRRREFGRRLRDHQDAYDSKEDPCRVDGSPVCKREVEDA